MVTVEWLHKYSSRGASVVSFERVSWTVQELQSENENKIKDGSLNIEKYFKCKVNDAKGNRTSWCDLYQCQTGSCIYLFTVKRDCIVLYCTELYCIVLYCIVLYCIRYPGLDIIWNQE